MEFPYGYSGVYGLGNAVLTYLSRKDFDDSLKSRFIYNSRLVCGSIMALTAAGTIALQTLAPELAEGIDHLVHQIYLSTNGWLFVSHLVEYLPFYYNQIKIGEVNDQKAFSGIIEIASTMYPAGQALIALF